jgi:hypothetical protein
MKKPRDSFQPPKAKASTCYKYSTENIQIDASLHFHGG